MATYSQLVVVGYLGNDPDFKFTTSGIAVCNFNVAVTHISGRDDQRTETTTWYRVTVWRELAETVSNLLKKGQQVMVVSEKPIRADAYINREGKPSASLSVEASRVVFLGKRDESGGAQRSDESSSEDSETDDLPF